MPENMSGGQASSQKKVGQHMSQGSKPLEHTLFSPQTSLPNTRSKIKLLHVSRQQRWGLAGCGALCILCGSHAHEAGHVLSCQNGSEKEQCLIPPGASLKGIRADEGTMYGHGVDPICHKFPEGKGEPTSYLSFPLIRVAKGDLLPLVGLAGIVFDPEKQEERMDK